WLDLREHMLAIQRHDRFAELQQFIISRPQLLFRSRVLLLHVLNRRLQVRFWRIVLPVLSIGPLHHVLFVPNLCLIFSHSRLDFSSFGPSLFTSAIHSSSEQLVFSFKSSTHFCTIATPGCTS